MLTNQSLKRPKHEWLENNDTITWQNTGQGGNCREKNVLSGKKCDNESFTSIHANTNECTHVQVILMNQWDNKPERQG